MPILRDDNQIILTCGHERVDKRNDKLTALNRQSASFHETLLRINNDENSADLNLMNEFHFGLLDYFLRNAKLLYAHLSLPRVYDEIFAATNTS